MIKLLASSLIVDNALAYARSHKLAPLTVAVLDARGCTVALKAEDGSSLLRPEIAQGKAWGALGMGVGTRNLALRAEKLPAFFNTLAALSGGRGRVFGAVLGALTLTIASNIINLLGINATWQDVIVGGILLLAVVLDRGSRALSRRVSRWAVAT